MQILERNRRWVPLTTSVSKYTVVIRTFLRTVFHSMLQILSCPPPRGYNETCIFREEFDEMRRSPESLRARISSRVRVMCTSHCLI